MIHTFEFNNKKLIELGALITEKPILFGSSKELEFSSLPGKSGDVVIDKKRFKNKVLSYKIASVPTLCPYNSQQLVYALKEWLLTCYDYKMLRDTYNTGYFRKAVCTDVSDPVVDAEGLIRTTATFNCDPFLYDMQGINEIVVNSSTTLINSEMWDSEPIFKVNGSGAFTISVNSDSFEITLNGTEITIDKPNEDVYYTSTGISCNDKISALALPYFQPGENIITIGTTSGTNFSMSIIPNWRRL